MSTGLRRVSHAVIKRNTRPGHLSFSLGGVDHSREPSAVLAGAIVVIQRGIRLVRVWPPRIYTRPRARLFRPLNTVNRENSRRRTSRGILEFRLGEAIQSASFLIRFHPSHCRRACLGRPGERDLTDSVRHVQSSCCSRVCRRKRFLTIQATAHK